MAIADEIAQYTHDLEDGLRGKVISTEELKEVSLIKKYVFEQFGDSDRSKILENGRLQSLVGVLIDDVVQSSEKLIETYHKENGVPNFSSKTDVYHKCCIVFSEAMKELTDDLDEKKKKLIITSQEISKSDAKAELFIRRIYRAYYKHPRQLPNYILERYFSQKGRTLDRGDLKEAELQHDNVFHRIICDHISGMTDQYAAREYLELYYPEFY